MTGTNRPSRRRGRRGGRRGSGLPWRTTLWRAGFWSTALCVGLPLALIVLLRWAPPPTTAFMLRSAWLSGTAVEASAEVERLAPPTYRWTDWEKIAPQAALAVIASEDQKFPDHSGFDVEAIQMALEDAREGGRLRGASTISQQTAKNLFLWPGRSFVRKGLEAYLTVLIELCWSKQRIVEVYLNVAEFGGGLFGITAASEHFFGKTPSELTADEAALLAAVLPNPARLRVEDPSPYVRERQAWIRRHMRQLGGVDLVAALD
ncbi:MAG: monofunctional biosynthetic peptidoglycan transglycosylase [Acidobacteria bacterium]|nr:monofunctional biosynthetic peptidoglycan transglycosylase [Acidobacteriota bacterium]MYJ04774.1 monofunctional biosynthetic peptidoglycan transglycosylase [Acidobacteriota bacterium]